MSFLDEDEIESAASTPEDIASAARSCQAILILFGVLLLLLFAAFLVCLLS